MKRCGWSCCVWPALLPVRRRQSPTAPAPAVRGWHIRFVALPHCCKPATIPCGVFRELQTLGRLEVKQAFVLESAPSNLAQLDPTQCFLGWELCLHGAVARADVAGVFDWLEGDCELALTALAERRRRLPTHRLPVCRQHRQPHPARRLRPASAASVAGRSGWTSTKSIR